MEENRELFLVAPKKAQGQTLPLRGAKIGPLEGGVRVFALMAGGYIDDVLRKQKRKSYEYDGLVHVSDWYNILFDIINQKNRNADEDHQVEIWKDIKKDIKDKRRYSLFDFYFKNYNKNKYKGGRKEIISTRMCEDGSYYLTYIRNENWKLVVNGSNELVNNCPAPLRTDWQVISGYAFPDGSFSKVPVQDIYLEQIGNKDTKKLYNSKCYNKLSEAEREDPDLDVFQFSEVMLFDIDNDKIEACNVADEYPEIVATLLGRLKEATMGKYDGGGFVVPVSPAAILKQVNTYDCEFDTTFLMPWGGEDPDLTDFNGIWQQYIDNKNNCQ